jgi:hypothetical protein
MCPGRNVNLMSMVQELNFWGLAFAGMTFVAIGLGFLWVVKLEYHVGAHVAKGVGALGIASAVASAFLPGFFASAVVGMIAGTIFWGATELSDQEERVRKGMFRANPRRRPRGEGA